MTNRMTLTAPKNMTDKTDKARHKSGAHQSKAVLPACAGVFALALFSSAAALANVQDTAPSTTTATTSTALEANNALTAAPDLSGAAPSVQVAIEEETQNLALLVQDSEDPMQIRDGWISLGDTLLAHEFNAQARTAYDSAAAIAGSSDELAYRQGLLAWFDGRVDDAIKGFDRAVASPDEALQTTALVRRGRAYLDRGDFESAGLDFATALALNPDSPAALAGAGRAALAAGDPEQAITHLEQALRLDPGASLLYQPLGLAYREMGDSERARSALARVGEGEVSLPDPVLAVIRSKSRSPQFWLQSGLAQADLGNFTAAADQIGRAASLAPDDLQILAIYGRVLAHLGELDLAREALQRVVEGQEADMVDWLYLGRVNQGLGQFDEARQDYIRASEMDPASADPQEALARIDLHEGKAEEAARQFAGLAERANEPQERARFGYWQSISLLSVEDCITAAEVLDNAMAAAKPVASDLLQVAARVRATCMEPSEESLEQAVLWAESAYDRQPDLLSAETLAMVYAAIGKWEDAEGLQRQAMFEALKVGELESRTALLENLQRYQEKLTATQPFMQGDPVFSLNQ